MTTVLKSGPISSAAAQAGSRLVIRGETPEELIQQYVQWLGTEPSVNVNIPASVGFILSESVPAVFGADIAFEKPQLVYSEGQLSAFGHGLAGHGSARSSNDNFGQSQNVFVQLDPSGVLRVNSISNIKLTLQHDVLVGDSDTTGDRSRSMGTVLTLMLWGIHAAAVR